MKYAVLYDMRGDIVEYTISVIIHLMRYNGHEIVPPEEADLIAVSVCDVSQIKYVEKVRKLYPHKKILVGGHAAIYYKLFGIFADYVSLGQGFELFECQTIDEIENLPSVWVRGVEKPVLIPSTKIDWTIVPVANVTKKQKYYWGAVGCKNKCKFCLTSWTNPHQKNDHHRIKQVLKQYPNCTIVSNDSEDIPSRRTQSIMLKDFLVKPLKKYAVYRIGVEFATEASRRKYGKPFSDDMFVQAVDRAYDEGVRLKLFCISGIDTIEEWDSLFSKLHPHYQAGNIEVKFTNIVYEMFTPIKEERLNIDISRMFSTQKAREFVNKHKMTNFALKSLPCMSVRDCLAKNILLYTTNADEYVMQKRIYKEPEEVMVKYFKELAKDNDYSDTVKINLKPIVGPGGEPV